MPTYSAEGAWYADGTGYAQGVDEQFFDVPNAGVRSWSMWQRVEAAPPEALAHPTWIKRGLPALDQAYGFYIGHTWGQAGTVNEGLGKWAAVTTYRRDTGSGTRVASVVSPVWGDADFAWHHFVLTVNRTSKVVAFYVDGALLGTATIPDTVDISENERPYFIWSDADQEKFSNAWVRNLYVWDLELSAAQVSALYAVRAGQVTGATGVPHESLLVRLAEGPPNEAGEIVDSVNGFNATPIANTGGNAPVWDAAESVG